jgi:hypothetical protein
MCRGSAKLQRTNQASHMQGLPRRPEVANLLHPQPLQPLLPPPPPAPKTCYPSRRGSPLLLSMSVSNWELRRQGPEAGGACACAPEVSRSSGKVAKQARCRGHPWRHGRLGRMRMARLQYRNKTVEVGDGRI